MVSFKERLDNLETIKIELKDKLIEYGISEPTDVLANYPDKIREIKNELMREVELGKLPLYEDSEFIVEGDWTLSTTPLSEHWCSICYGDGKFVAVQGNQSDASNVIYSEDGINWNTTTMPDAVKWTSICYGNGKFVAVTENGGASNTGDTDIVAYSEDGVAWNLSTLPVLGNWRTVCYGNGKFVALDYNSSNSGQAVYSEDGITWNTATMPALGTWLSVCYGSDKFVAIGGTNSSTRRGAYSADGITWTGFSMPTTAEHWCSICFGNGKYVAISKNSYGGSNIAAYSADGITWTTSTMPSTTVWSHVCYGNGKYIAIANFANSNIVASSEDGITWTQATLPSSQNWWSVCYGKDKFVVTGIGNIAYKMSGVGLATLHYDQTDTIIPSYLVQSVKDHTKNWVDNFEFIYTGTDITKDNFELFCSNGLLYIVATVPSSTYFNIPTLSNSYNVTLDNYTQKNDTYGTLGVYKLSVTPDIPVNVTITMTASSTTRNLTITVDY